MHPMHPVDDDDRDREAARDVAAGNVEHLGLVAVAVLALDEAGGVRRHLGGVADRVDVVVHQLGEDGRADDVAREHKG